MFVGKQINQEITLLIIGPEELRRKRQRIEGDSLHSSLQQPHKKIQSDHAGGRMTSWNTPNIPAIKSEPREASPKPLPFAAYRAPSEMTPSPQPLSPLNYNYPNTSSPYNMTVVGNAPLMSPASQQYRGSTGGGGVVASTDRIPASLEIHNEFNAYAGDQQQQQQQQQLQQQQPHHSRQYVRQNQLSHQHEPHQRPPHHQTQYPNLVYDNTDVANWEQKYSNVLSNTGTATMNNLNPNEMQFNLQNMLMATASGTAEGAQLTHWNFPPTHEGVHMHHQQNLQVQQQQATQPTFQEQHQQQQLQPTSNNDTTMADVNRANIDVAADVEQGPTISTLMNFDSEQLVHINSEEQQMLRLTSEELRLSNLSISS